MAFEATNYKRNLNGWDTSQARMPWKNHVDLISPDAYVHGVINIFRKHEVVISVSASIITLTSDVTSGPAAPTIPTVYVNLLVSTVLQKANAYNQRILLFTRAIFGKLEKPDSEPLALGFHHTNKLTP